MMGMSTMTPSTTHHLYYLTISLQPRSVFHLFMTGFIQFRYLWRSIICGMENDVVRFFLFQIRKQHLVGVYDFGNGVYQISGFFLLLIVGICASSLSAGVLFCLGDHWLGIFVDDFRPAHCVGWVTRRCPTYFLSFPAWHASSDGTPERDTESHSLEVVNGRLIRDVRFGQEGG
jgi:hypothetical protein